VLLLLSSGPLFFCVGPDASCGWDGVFFLLWCLFSSLFLSLALSYTPSRTPTTSWFFLFAFRINYFLVSATYCCCCYSSLASSSSLGVNTDKHTLTHRNTSHKYYYTPSFFQSFPHSTTTLSLLPSLPSSLPPFLAHRHSTACAPRVVLLLLPLLLLLLLLLLPPAINPGLADAPPPFADEARPPPYTIGLNVHLLSSGPF